jgi:protein SCO1
MKLSRWLPLVLTGIILITGILIAWKMNIKQAERKDRLPVFNPTELNDSLVDPSLRNVGTGHHVRDFSLINQDGETITQKNLEGKIYVADFFFIRCGSICPKMTSQLQRVQEKFREEKKVMILSHTVLPETDTVEAMKAYAEQYGADHSQWYFLTGDKKQIYDLARKSYFVVKDAAPGKGDEENDFIHTENFVLVDSQKRIRGYYDGTSEQDVSRLLSDMDKLLKEEEDTANK